MAQIAIERLEVTSFFTEDTGTARAEAYGYAGEEVRAFTRAGGACICTGDISTCARTSVAGGCDTSVQCVTH